MHKFTILKTGTPQYNVQLLTLQQNIRNSPPESAVFSPTAVTPVPVMPKVKLSIMSRLDHCYNKY